MRREMSADPNMRAHGSRAAGWRARLSGISPFAVIEYGLIALVAVQAARLVWALATPLGPLGDWRPPASLNTPPPAGALGAFDPFFRLAEASGPAVVTGLNLQLFGVREDRATGRGSAIIGLPDGSQRSFAVGEELIPGVTLAEVGFDSVTIDRSGTREQIFLDQSQPAPAANPQGQSGQPQAPAPAPAATVPVPRVAAAPAAVPLQFAPRMSENQITGLLVSPGGDGGRAFRAAGFQPGDAIVAVNGQRVVSAQQAEAMLRAAGGSATLTVDRGGRNVQISVRF